MPSKEEVSEFFQRFSRKVTGGEGDKKQPESASKLMTQVSQDASAKQVTHAKSNTANNARLAEIRSMPKNLSPVDPTRHPALLPRPLPSYGGKKCLVLDVDETLVHSSYQPTKRYDLHLPLRVNGAICNVYVAYRPYLKEFLNIVQEMFEIVIFTASVKLYCDPLLDILDPNKLLGPARLFREHCTVVNGTYVKDLSLLGRPLDQIVIIDNSPAAYLFQPRNAIPCTSWFEDPNDCELADLVPLLEYVVESKSVYDVLDEYNSQLEMDD